MHIGFLTHTIHIHAHNEWHPNASNISNNWMRKCFSADDIITWYFEIGSIMGRMMMMIYSLYTRKIQYFCVIVFFCIILLFVWIVCNRVQFRRQFVWKCSNETSKVRNVLAGVFEIEKKLIQHHSNPFFSLLDKNIIIVWWLYLVWLWPSKKLK